MSSPSTHDHSNPTTDPWEGFTHDEALAWARVTLRYLPRPSGAGILGSQVVQPHRGPGPAIRRAGRQSRGIAVALGFTPATFAAWIVSLRWVPATRYAAHPHNHTVEHPLSQPGHTFDAEVCAGWPFLLTRGLYARKPRRTTRSCARRSADSTRRRRTHTTRRACTPHATTRSWPGAARATGSIRHTDPKRWSDADSRERDRLPPHRSTNRRRPSASARSVTTRRPRPHIPCCEVRDGFDMRAAQVGGCTKTCGRAAGRRGERRARGEDRRRGVTPRRRAVNHSRQGTSSMPPAHEFRVVSQYVLTERSLRSVRPQTIARPKSPRAAVSPSRGSASDSG